MLKLVHEQDCNAIRTLEERWSYDATKVRYLHCYYCGALVHEPLKFKDSECIGYLTKWPDLQHTPYGHESGLLDIEYGANDYTFNRPSPEKLPVLVIPVPIGFYPYHSLDKDDAKEHEGVSFRELWTDPLTRTIWLGYKRFMLTDQHFRSYCIGHAMDLRKHPEKLLRANVAFHFGYGIFQSPWSYAIGAQLVPFLINALDSEGLWPYFRLNGITPLQWSYKRKAA